MDVPGDECGLAWIYAVQALREPGIDVEAHSRVRERGNRPLIQGHGMALQALEVVAEKAGRLRPQDTLSLVLGKPKIEGSDHLVSIWTDLLIASG